MSQGVFITGTDTEIGKTRVSLVLMEYLKRQGYRVAGMKPIASGAEWVNGKLVNDDADQIKQHCSRPVDYEQVNPCPYSLPIAPHIAAKQENKIIDIDLIQQAYQTLLSENDIVIVEGVGGWRVPISETETLPDLVKALGLPVIMVVGMRLGCINHALLTASAISEDGSRLLAWVSNQAQPEEYLYKHETIATLSARLTCRHLVDLPFFTESLVDRAWALPDLNWPGLFNLK